MKEVIIDSSYVYKNLAETNDSKTLGGLTRYATVIKVLSSIDDGTNDYLNSSFTKTQEGDYNVYIWANQYTEVEGGYELTKYIGNDEHVIIPDSYNGLPVVSIGANLFQSNKIIKSVTLGENVTSIGNNAFNGCSNLETIIFNDSLVSIENNAFYNCYSLTSLILPDSVEEIGQYAFYGCSSIQSLTIGEGVKTIGGSAFSGLTMLSELNFNAVRVESSNLIFQSAGQSTDGLIVTFGDSVELVPASIFNPVIT